jgi:tetratricopeptide (TPR) repeat protein
MKLRYHFFLLALLLGAYSALLVPFTSYMRQKPVVEKLGLVPSPEALLAVSADQKQLVAAAVISKVIQYFGGLGEMEPSQTRVPPDFPAMSRTIHGALRVDPYNLDGYYFAQAVLVWDVKQYRLANDLLEYGMKYRTWDASLPFFAGFNYAFFLKDYTKAAQMYQRAGALSGNQVSISLASRYLQQSGQTEMAILYLSSMEKGARDPAIRKSFQIRLQAFRGVLAIEQARDRFLAERGALPARVDELVATGYLKELPADPYGGTFYLESDGAVASTSKFSIVGGRNASKKGK